MKKRAQSARGQSLVPVINSNNAMADSYGVQTTTMRDTTNFITENGVDNFDTASQGSKDECVEFDNGFTEDRFRVDRKKLEQMLQLGKQKIGRVSSFIFF